MKVVFGYHGDAPRMIDMTMGEDNVGNQFGIDEKHAVFLGAFFAPTLKHAAVKQNPIRSAVEQMHGSGNFSGRTVKCDVHILLLALQFST